MVINVFFSKNPVTHTESYTKSIEYAVPEQLGVIHPVTSVVMSSVCIVKNQTGDILGVSAEPEYSRD